MQQSDFDDFSGMLGAVSELYNRGGLSDFALSIWWNALAQYDLAAVRQALDRHVKNPDTGQFMPKPADVIRMIAGNTKDSALMAWAKVDRAIRHIGTYQSVIFDDALIHRVVQEMGGWVEIGSKEDKEWPFVQKEFETRYRGYKMRGETPEYPAVLIGLAEAHNSTEGFLSQAPLLLGDTAAARAVVIGGANVPILVARQHMEWLAPKKLIAGA
jgi:hypothetical protein